MEFWCLLAILHVKKVQNKLNSHIMKVNIGYAPTYISTILKEKAFTPHFFL